MIIDVLYHVIQGCLRHTRCLFGGNTIRSGRLKTRLQGYSYIYIYIFFFPVEDELDLSSNHDWQQVALFSFAEVASHELVVCITNGP